MSRTSSTSTRLHLLVFLMLIGNSLVPIKCFPSSLDAGALSPSIMFSNENSKQDKANKIANNEKASKDAAALSPDEANTISVIMTTLMPSMFNLFRNITPDEFKANFKEPCRFDALLDIFKQMPPLFDKIATRYPNKPDLVAYYSMQLASTFLVNNGSLTMACLYNMLSLQTRLMTFSLDIMDNPERNPALVGLFGIFMKPVMGMLKKNAMMQIIDHVDRYDKNDDMSNVTLFNVLNVIYCLLGLVGIVSNVFLVILLRRSSTVVDKQRALNLKRTMEKLNEKQKMIQHAAPAALKLQSSLSGKSKTRGAAAAGVVVSEKPEMRSKKRVINTSEEIEGDKNARLKIKNELTSMSTTSTNPKSHHKSSSRNPIASSHHKRHSKRHTANRKQPRHHHHHKKSRGNKKNNSKYKLVKKTQIQLNYIVNKRYNTRICFIIIAICHSIYLFMNFMVMSQASVAAMGLQSISKLNMACKISFMLFPPTTIYTFLHQMAIWLLVFALRQHAIKIRTTPTHAFDDEADYEASLMTSESSDLNLNSDYSESDNDANSSYSDEDDDGYNNNNRYKNGTGGAGNIYNSFDDDDGDSHNRDDEEEEGIEEEDTVSQSLTNNSQPSSTTNQQQQQQQQHNLSSRHVATHSSSLAPLVSSSSLGFNTHGGQKATVQFMDTTRFPMISQQNQPLLPASMHIMSNNPYNTNLTVATLPNNSNTRCFSSSPHTTSKHVKAIIAQNRKNILFCSFLFIVLFIYNGQNLFLYSLSELRSPNAPTIYYCAFEQAFSDYYTLLNQYVIPLTNLVLFAALPLALCTMQVLFDICFLVRVQREQMKRYLKLRDIIEWPVYLYYFVYMISQLPFAMQQINDLILGTVKFPFVFPLFIQLKFTSKVWFTVIEMTLLCLACSADLYIWIVCDREMRQLAKYWLNKRIFCRTYAKSNKEKLNSHASTSSRSYSGSSSSRSDSNSVEMCERNISTTIKHPAVAVSSSTSTAMTGIALTAPHSSSLLNQQATNSHHHHHHHSNTNNQHQGYASSTLSSTTSSHNHNNNHNTNQLYQSKKKSISPIIAESIKASASLSASNTTAELFDSPNSPVSKNQIIRMIDTDNEDNTTNANDVSNDSSDLPIRLDKLDEEEQKQQQQQTLDTSMSAVYEKNMHPPSFKTALSSRPLFSSNFNSSSSHQSSEFRHQYQNDIDLNIHPSTLPKIVQHTQ